jgi:hypothetical protein
LFTLISKRGFFLFLAAICFVFIGSEAAFRLRYFGADSVLRFWHYSGHVVEWTHLFENSPDPLIAYKLKANADVWYRGAILKTNSSGFRGERDFHSAPGRGPVVVLGRSVEMGTGVRMGEAWPEVLEKRIGEPVFNYGVSGYTWVQMKRVYDTVARETKPRLVLLPVYLLEWDLKIPATPSKVDLSWKQWLNPRFIVESFFLPGYLRHLSDEIGSRLVARDWDALATQKIMTERKTELESLDVLLGQLIAQIQSDGAKVVIIAMPRPRKELERHREEIRAGLKVWCEQHDVGLIHTDLELDRSFGFDDTIFPGDPHPKAWVHEKIADSVVRGLARLHVAVTERAY